MTARCRSVLLYFSLAAGRTELEALHDVYFDSETFRSEYGQGLGSDLLYIARVVFEPGWDDRGIDYAVVRRLCDTLGAGCELGVVPSGRRQKPVTGLTWDGEHTRT